MVSWKESRQRSHEAYGRRICKQAESCICKILKLLLISFPRSWHTSLEKPWNGYQSLFLLLRWTKASKTHWQQTLTNFWIMVSIICPRVCLPIFFLVNCLQFSNVIKFVRFQVLSTNNFIAETIRQIPPKIEACEPKSRASFPLSFCHANNYISKRIALIG
jgi:hypothetical protein